MSEKLCVFCEHIRMDVMGCHGDYPDPAYFECIKGHWQFIEWDNFRTAIIAAQTCPDYKQVK